MNQRVVKVAMVGAGGTGKTTIASRLVTGRFVETMMTAGLGIETWSLVDQECDGEIKATIFDLGGQEQFRFFQSSLLKGTQVVLLVVDLTRFRTLIEIDEWIDLIPHVSPDMWVLVANKLDAVDKSLSEQDIAEKAHALDIPYILLSAKTGENFDRLIEILTNILQSSL